jgi:hypothetical protein
MAVPISKLAPTAVVVAAVSFCGWPYIFTSDAGNKQATTMPVIAPSQLSPRLLPPPARNPFRPAAEPIAQAPQPTKTATTATAGGKDAIATRSGHAKHGKPPADPLGDLTLTATSILAGGTRYPGSRLAVINGRIYAERETIKSKDPSAPPCVVARILPDCVLLECEGRTTTLSYTNLLAQAKTNHASGRPGPNLKSQIPTSKQITNPN